MAVRNTFLPRLNQKADPFSTCHFYQMHCKQPSFQGAEWLNSISFCYKFTLSQRWMVFTFIGRALLHCKKNLKIFPTMFGFSYKDLRMPYLQLPLEWAFAYGSQYACSPLRRFRWRLICKKPDALAEPCTSSCLVNWEGPFGMFHKFQMCIPAF